MPVAEYSMLLGVKLKKRPVGVGTPQEILPKYGLATDGWVLYSNFSTMPSSSFLINILPAKMLIVITREDDTAFGILHSPFHLDV